MELEKQKGKKVGVAIWLTAASVLILLCLSYFIGMNGAKVELENEKAGYDELIAEIDSKEYELEKIQAKIDESDEQFKAKEAEYKEALKTIEYKNTVESEIGELNKQIESKKGEIGTLEETIKAKNAELASVEGKIKEKKEAPKVLSAGFFTVGKDIPEGRYKVVPNGGSGNFFVNDGMSVNIMIGRGEFYEEEYVFTAYEGDVIELTTSAKFIPVE